MLSLAKDLGAKLLAHAIARDHLACELGGALKVVGGAGRDVVAEEFFRRAAGQKHRDLVVHAASALEELVLVGELKRVAQGLPAADDADFVHRI